MSNGYRLARAACAAALTFALATAVRAQVQDSDQVKCAATMAKDIAKVAAAQGKINAACVKDGTKGTVTPGCPLSDPKGALGTMQSKTEADETKNCVTKAPDFGYTSALTGNGAAIRNERDLLVDTYGDTDLTGVVSTAKAVGACQSAVTKNLEKIAAAMQKDYAGCKKAALKGGAAAADALEACVGADAKGKVATATAKLGADASAKCGSVDVAAAFPGRCAGPVAADVASCLGKRARCQMCEAINEADALEADCDTIDDGVQNGSCGLRTHLCTLGNGSALTLYATAYNAGVIMPIVGSSLRVGGIHGVGHCEVESFNPVNIVGLGLVCIAPASGCPDGMRYCGPGAPASGPALGIDVASDADIGSCTTNAACRSACDVHCAGLGSAQLASGCVGYCSGNKPDGMACTTDAQCRTAGNGACHGPNHPTGHEDICQCTCVNDGAFGASDPGDMQCNLGVRLTVETAAPCDGTDVQIDLGTMCLPLTTERAKGKIVDANFTPAATVPAAMPGPNANDRTGVELSCEDVDAGNVSGLQPVGAFTIFGSSTLGDLSFGMRAICQ